MRPPFQKALDLWQRFNDLKKDIRGIARLEQHAIAHALKALDFPECETSEEYSAVMGCGMYAATDDMSFCEFWDDGMQDVEDQNNYAWYLASEWEKASPSYSPETQDDIPF